MKHQVGFKGSYLIINIIIILKNDMTSNMINRISQLPLRINLGPLSFFGDIDLKSPLQSADEFLIKFQRFKYY